MTVDGPRVSIGALTAYNGRALGADLRRRIYRVVARIPLGRVATYGQVAALAGLPGHARQVGYALHGLPSESDLPWHRVVNAQGRISPRSEPGPSEGLQRHLLEEEGVRFDERDRIDLRRYRWRGTMTAKRS